MRNALKIVPDPGPPTTPERHLSSVDGTVSGLPELSSIDARRLAVSLLEQAEREAPAPRDTGIVPYGWRRLSLVVPRLDEEAAVVDFVHALRAEEPPANLARIVAALNERGSLTRSGVPWHINAVKRLLKANPPEKRKRWTVPTVQRFL